jgi:ABC-type dipeptide/oligopeptide/nickel transport system ATPase component
VSPSPILSVRLSVSYAAKQKVLNDLSLEIFPGEILALVGQSGCGKSTLALAILKLLYLKKAGAEGSIVFRGRELMGLSEREMRAIRGKDISLVLQSPLSALNPALRIGKQLEEAWQVHRKTKGTECSTAIASALENVSLPSDTSFLRRFPSELSVGQAQRVLIAMAVLHRPALLIADEPTSALDIVTQAEVLQLFSDLSRKLGTSILYISHDLLSVSTISQRVAVMHQGEIVECRPTAEIFTNPSHPYTQQLIRALPAMPTFANAASSGW